MKRKMFSALLCVCMLVSLLPAAAAAYADDGQTVAGEMLVEELPGEPQQEPAQEPEPEPAPEEPVQLEYIPEQLFIDGYNVIFAWEELHQLADSDLGAARDQLLDEVWGFEYYGDSRTIDVHIKRLREKLEGVSDKWELKTVWGVGYKFETDEED